MPEGEDTFRVRCINLCCKSMVVYGENFEEDPDYQAGTTDFWCIQTSKGQGPDGDGVSMQLCTNRERECFQEY
jgi:hypothetical protein